MIIELPRSFIMNSPINTKGAFVENGMLKIGKEQSFRKVMTEITYQIKGRNRCCYCGKIIPEEEMTIDHMYPQAFGGPTITNNMLPSCKKCNNEKGDLNPSQYKAYLKAKEKGEINKFRAEIQKYRKFMRELVDFDIPQEWLSEEEISKLIVMLDLEDNYKGQMYNKISRYYEKNHHFQKPVIIGKNDFVFDGFLATMYAKNVGLKRVPVIRMDNVEVIL